MNQGVIRTIHIIFILFLGGYMWMYAMGGHVSTFQNFGIALMGSVGLFFGAWVASRAPTDIVREMFGPGQIASILFAMITSGIWVVGALCSSLPNATEMDLSFMSVLYGIFIYLPTMILGFVLTLINPFIVGASIAFLIPYMVMGVIAMATTTDSLKVAQEQAGTKLPDDQIEKMLAEAMERDTTSDEEITKIIYQLPLFSRIMHTFRYKVKQKKYFEIWQLLNAQEEMLREQTKTARAAHGYERAKRDGI